MSIIYYVEIKRSDWIFSYRMGLFALGNLICNLQTTSAYKWRAVCLINWRTIDSFHFLYPKDLDDCWLSLHDFFPDVFLVCLTSYDQRTEFPDDTLTPLSSSNKNTSKAQKILTVITVSRLSSWGVSSAPNKCFYFQKTEIQKNE
jgi:hypothetical protein